MATSKSEILFETKFLVEELLKQPERAKKAIHDRNIIIKGLRSEIDHRIVAFTEIDGRFQELSLNMDAVSKKMKILEQVTKDNEKELKRRQDEINKKNEELHNKSIELKKIKAELDVYKEKESHTFKAKWLKFAEFFPDWKGYLIRQLATQKGFTYLLIVIVFILGLQSVIGWAPILSVVKTILTIFS